LPIDPSSLTRWRNRIGEEGVEWLLTQTIEAGRRSGVIDDTGVTRVAVYALHEPEVDCISKGKARVRDEFGCKVSIATTLDEGFVVGMRSFAGNPYDGHGLGPALEQVAILTDQRPDLAVVDRGYREEATRVRIGGTRRGLTPKLIADLRRRSAIEAEIGHMKTDGRLTRCTLKDTIGAALCACGHNIRKILAHLRAWLVWMIAALLAANNAPARPHQIVIAA
jgi:transposase, IS5 family